MNAICIGLVFAQGVAYYRGVLRGIRRYVETRPRWRFISIVPDQQSLEVLHRLKPDGLIASANMQPLARTLSSWRRPVVNVANVLAARFPRVGADEEQISALAAAHFLEHGLAHFGFAGHPRCQFSAERKSAFCRLLQKAGHSVACYESRAHMPFDPLGPRWDMDPGVQRWLRALPKPVGVFVPSDVLAVQVAEACWRVKLRVPEDVALLGVDNDELYCELCRPPLSSIILPAERIGYEAAALLEQLIAGEKPPAAPILLPPIGVATRRSSEVLAVDDEEVVAAVRFIREHAHLPLRVDDVLQQVPTGRRTLERRCRKALGWGLGAEIRRTHLERARRLLAETDLPLKVLAEQAGFSDLGYMGKVFRQELGMPPTAYRGQLRRTAMHGRQKTLT